MLPSPRRRKIFRQALRSIFPTLESLEPRVLLAGHTYTIGSYAFTGGTDGATPFGGLVADSHNDLFGTGASGGTASDGTLFELAAGTSTPNGLYTFTGTPAGANPYGQLTIDAQGNLFGTSLAGGANGDGSIFEVPTGSTTPMILYSFSGSNGANPYAGVTLDATGDIFGTTVNGGALGQGTVFEIPLGGTLITLHSFNGPSDGANPYAPLLVDGSGNLWGTTFAGGSSGDGTLFEISGGTFQTLHSFNGADGAKPTSRLVMDGGGNLLGTTNAGGAAGDGTIFGIAASGGTLTPLYSFTGGIDGANPYADLVFDTAGNLFGTTYRGGAHGDGTVFEIPVNGAVPQTLYSFTGGADGASPYGSLYIGANGSLFGTATAGGTGGRGTLFELSPTLTTQITVTQPPGDVQAGAAMTPAVVVDLKLANGNINSADNSSVTLSIVSGPDGGTLSGTTTVQAINGVATFNHLILKRAGTYTLAAADGALAPVTLASFVVHAGPAARLAFDTPPTGLIAGQTMAPVTLDVEDALGNVTTDNSMVTLKLGSAPAGALLSGTLAEPAISGRATFSDLSLSRAGSYTLSVSDGKFPVIKSASFLVSPDTASAQISITHQPGNTIVGKKIAPPVTVAVVDQFANLIVSNSTPITASLVVVNLGGNATAAALTGTLTVNTVKGAASFGNLAISQPGNYAIQLSADGLAAVTTSSLLSYFVPTHSVFSQPLPAVAGATMTPITVSIEDSSNHIDTTNNSLITLALKGNATLNGTLSVPAINGVATFNDLSLMQAGTYTLSATAVALTPAKSASFRVLPDVSTAHLVLSQPPVSSTIVGKTLAPALVASIKDQFGNLVTSDHSAATVNIATGPTSGTLTGITTVNANGGVLTFKNLTLTEAGVYSLQVADPSLALPTPVLVAQTMTPGATSVSGLPPSSTHLFGQTVALSANFKSTAPSAIPFTAMATLVDAAHDVLGSVTLTSAGQARFSIPGLAPGAYLCHIIYPGDANHTSVTSSTFTLQVNLAATSTALVASPSTLVFGQSLTLTATVSSSNAPAIVRTGNVSFFDGLTPLGTATLDGNAMASLTLTTASVGKHTFKAVYSGDGNFKTSASSGLGRSVNKDQSSITLTPTLASPIPVNQTFNLNMQVALIAPGVSALTGNLVTIKDNGKVLTTLNLDSHGNASLPGLSYSAPGAHTLIAIYGGDANTLAVTSSLVQLTIT